MNVVLLCRVSTNHQDYNRQISELTDYCTRQGWHIEKVFANKISGAKTINTLEALKVIQMLNEAGICLYVKNYNLETIIGGKVNPVASLICTILLEIAQMERLTIAERMTSGRNQYIKKCREQGIKMGRPSSYRKSDEAYKEEYAKDLSLLRKGISLRNINSITGTSVMTLRKLKNKYVDSTIK